MGSETGGPGVERPPEIAEMAARMGAVGLWAPQLQWQPAEIEREAVERIEGLGFGAVWVGEATGKEVLSHAGILLAAGTRLVVATGIASIWARDPMAMANGGRTLAEGYPGRFVLGLGVSHPFLAQARDRDYKRPLTHMRTYLEAMDRAPFAGPQSEQAPRVLAALGPRMLDLARDQTWGAHTYFVPVEHTEVARDILGPGPLLVPEQAASLERDAASARAAARRYMQTYLALDNYTANLRRLGWTQEELSGAGSDRLVDALVAWGGVEEVLGRVRSHLDAGADHVAVRILGADAARVPFEEWEELSAALA